jgi:hypothetical protein
MSAYCGPVNVEIQKAGSTIVSVQPFSVSTVKHASTHYLSGSDQVDHNRLSGLQGGEPGEYYHLDAASYRAISSGVVAFSVDIPSGIDSTGVLFPRLFSEVPVVISNIQSPYSYTYLTSINNISLSGFDISFSSPINNTGFKLLNLVYTI